LRAREALPAIIVLLGDDNPSLRKDAAATLGEIADPASREALATRAQDADPDVRKTVAWALGRL
ncbi:MAG: HEAT repeat domain-containing protein, partial [Bradyrhizobium sp.]|nr:HEAT repeat domain-containing protein [Bradyrhizobium sp.]